MAESVLEKLKRARKLTIELRVLEENYLTLQPAPATPRLDGMPRAPMEPDATLIKLVDARNECMSLMISKRMELSDLHVCLAPRVSALEPHLLAFCMHYYIQGATIAETARRMDRTDRCIYDYKRRLAKVLDEPTEAARLDDGLEVKA